MKVENARVEDSGEYMFKAGNKSSTAKVVVDAVSITSSMIDVAVKETQKAVLQCEVSVSDSDVCQWTKDGNIISVSIFYIKNQIKLSSLI